MSLDAIDGEVQGMMPSSNWRSVRAVPQLGQGEVHVWRDALGMPSPWDSGEALSAEELTQAQRMSAPGRRDTFTRGRGLLRFLAGSYLGMAPAAVPIRLLPLGKPVIHLPGDSQLAVSLAHSGATLAVAATRVGDIGVDIESEDPSVDRRAIARRFFSKGEAAALEELPESAQLAGFFALWVRKEALLKAVGEGLSVPLSGVELAVAPGGAPAILRLPMVFGEPSSWTLEGIAIGPGMAGAIAVHGQVTSVAHLQWTN